MVDRRPILMVVSIVIVTDYSGLAAHSLGFVLLLAALLMGLTEETMFRGIGVAVFRSNGFTEGKVAMRSTVLCGLANATNLISKEPIAVVRVLTTTSRATSSVSSRGEPADCSFLQ